MFRFEDQQVDNHHKDSGEWVVKYNIWNPIVGGERPVTFYSYNTKEEAEFIAKAIINTGKYAWVERNK